MVNKNKLIRRRRIYFIRRMIFVLFISLIFFLVLINSSIFNVKYVNIMGNKFLSSEYLIQSLNGVFQKNIFFNSIDKEINSLKENKYIESISYSKKYPDTINVSVEEIEIDYYIYFNNDYYIFDRHSKLIDILDYKQEFDMLEIIGAEIPSDIQLGQNLFLEDSREVKWLENLREILDLNKSNINFDYVDLTDVYNVVLGYKNLQIKIGNNFDLRQKLNIAINTINSNPKFESSSGYIDVRSKNYPVISIN